MNKSEEEEERENQEYESSSDTNSSTSFETIPPDENYFPRILSIFYAIFHPTKGPQVIYQVPEGSIQTENENELSENDQKQSNNETIKPLPPQMHKPLINFNALSDFLIPKRALCGRLISYTALGMSGDEPGQTYKILSHPMIIDDQQKYPRNTFLYNLSFVFDGRADVLAYEPIVRKCARELKDLEQNNSFLSGSQFRMYELIEQLFEDLNSYYESFVALPDAPHSKYVNESFKAAELLRGSHSIIKPRNTSASTMSRPPTRRTSTDATAIPQLNDESPSYQDLRRGSATSSSGSSINGNRPIVSNRSKSLAALSLTEAITSQENGSEQSLNQQDNSRRSSNDALQQAPVLTNPFVTQGKREPPHGLGRTVRDALNVKLFPTYTNPKDVHDWDVPVSLLELQKRASDNWDLTMRKILPFVDGINHVKRIAQLADADLELVRQCIEHLLYYRCIIIIDIFQFTNLYTIKPTIATLANDSVIISECGSYITRKGYSIPSWPKLLSLYSTLRSSITLHEWIEENEIDSLGIDVRRFVTFGVIKGFLRRVHRYPILLVGEAGSQMDALIENSNRRRSSAQITADQEVTTPDGLDLNESAWSNIVRPPNFQSRKTRATVVDVANVAFNTRKENETISKSNSRNISFQSEIPSSGSRRRLSSLQSGIGTGTGAGTSYRGKQSNSYISGGEEESSFSYRRSRSKSSKQTIIIPPGFIEMLLNGCYPDDAFCVAFNRNWNEILQLMIFIGLQQQQSKSSSTTSPNRGRIGKNKNEQLDDLTIANESGINMSGFWQTPTATNRSIALPSPTKTLTRKSSQLQANTAFQSLKTQQQQQQQQQQNYQQQYQIIDPMSSSIGLVSNTNSNLKPPRQQSSFRQQSFNYSHSLGNNTFDPNNLSHSENERIQKGDLGRIQLIIK